MSALRLQLVICSISFIISAESMPNNEFDNAIQKPLDSLKSVAEEITDSTEIAQDSTPVEPPIDDQAINNDERVVDLADSEPANEDPGELHSESKESSLVEPPIDIQAINNDERSIDLEDSEPVNEDPGEVYSGPKESSPVEPPIDTQAINNDERSIDLEDSEPVNEDHGEVYIGPKESSPVEPPIDTQAINNDERSIDFEDSEPVNEDHGEVYSGPKESSPVEPPIDTQAINNDGRSIDLEDSEPVNEDPGEVYSGSKESSPVEPRVDIQAITNDEKIIDLADSEPVNENPGELYSGSKESSPVEPRIQAINILFPWTSPNYGMAPEITNECKSVYSCSDCHTSRICRPTLTGTFEEIMSIPCPLTAPNCDDVTGTCRYQASEKCLNPSNFICLSDGHFPDPDCKFYHVCKNLKATKVQCEFDHTYYNADRGVCDSEITYCGIFDCYNVQSVGERTPYSTSLKYFGYCGGGRDPTIIDKCPEGTGFNVTTQSCETMCSEIEGVLQDPFNCIKYYKCSKMWVTLNVWFMKKEHKECPPGTGFDPSNFICISLQDLPSCRVNQLLLT